MNAQMIFLIPTEQKNTLMKYAEKQDITTSALLRKMVSLFLSDEALQNRTMNQVIDERKYE